MPVRERLPKGNLPLSEGIRQSTLTDTPELFPAGGSCPQVGGRYGPFSQSPTNSRVNEEQIAPGRWEIWCERL